MAANTCFSTSSQDIGERPASFAWTSIRQEFVATPTRLQSAAKLAIGCTVTMLLCYIFDWPAPSSAMIPALLFSRADVRYDLRQSLWTIGSVACMGAFYYWSLNYAQNPLLFFLLLGGGLMLNGALTTLPSVGQAFSTGQLIPSAVLATYFYAPNLRENVFLPLTSELTLGFTVALGVNYLFWPYSPRKEWDQRFRRAWNECRRINARWFAGLEPAGGRATRPDNLDRRLTELFGLLNDRILPTDDADEGPAIRRAAARRLQEITILLQDLIRVGRGTWPQENAAAFARLGSALDARFLQVSRILAGQEPGEPQLTPDPTDEDDTSAPEAGGGQPVRQEDIHRLCATLESCPATYAALARLPQAESVTRREQSLTFTAPFSFATLSQLNLQSWQHGAKIALVVLAVLVIWQALRLPSGGTVLFIALLVMLPDAGRSSRQAIECALGVVLGLSLAFLSVVLVVKYVETIWGYGLCVFSVLFLLGYLAGASPRLAYIGFQGAISFVVVFVSSDRQTVNLEPLRERFDALVFGVAIALVVLHNLWPVRKVKDLFKNVAAAFAACAQAWGDLLECNREAWPGQRERFVREFNKQLAQGVALDNTIEFEGGEGSPRYGYAGRLLAHEGALFGQLCLFSADWTDLAAVGAPLPEQTPRIQERFLALAERLGHPVGGVPAEAVQAGSARPTGAALAPDPRWEVLQQRAAEIEQILASIDCLTALPVSD